MATLTTTRLRLEPIQRSHFEELYYLNTDMRVMQYITGRPITLEETMEHMELVKKNWAELGFSSWSLFDKDSNEYIGSGGIQHIEFNPDNPIEIGWRIKPARWGCGYATEAAQAMAQFFFETTSMGQLLAVCHPENRASERVMQHLGMQYDGIAPWYGIDVLVYKLTRAQYEAENLNAARAGLNLPVCCAGQVGQHEPIAAEL